MAIIFALVRFENVSDHCIDKIDSRGAVCDVAWHGRMDKNLSDGSAEAVAVEPTFGESNSVRNRRRRIDRSERRSLDNDLADRLDRLGMDPLLPNITTLTIMHTGRSFDLIPTREHWAFSVTAKAKAANFVTQFMAFQQHADTSTFQSFVIRPAGRKGGMGELMETIQRVSSDYSNVMTAAVKDDLAQPVATFIHVRFDTILKMWDVHLHVIADVKPTHSEQFSRRICKRFSTPKKIEPLKNVGAWANYCATWAIDHRDIQKWPDDALLELWNIRGVHLLRKGGEFAKFCRTLKGKTINRVGSGVVIEDKPHKPPKTLRRKAALDLEQVGYAVMRISGESCYVAIHRRPRVPRERLDIALKDTEAGHRESTTNTAPISTRSDIGHARTLEIPLVKNSSAVRFSLRRALCLWLKIWPCSRQMPRVVMNDDPRLPRPVRRRISMNCPSPSALPDLGLPEHRIRVATPAVRFVLPIANWRFSKSRGPVNG